jgi:type IV pilus assembly protein PilM
MRLFPTSLQSAVRPRLACEIAPDGVLAGGSVGVESPLDSAVFEALPEGSISVGVTAPIFRDNNAVVAALRRTLDSVDSHGRDWTMVLPDACTRVHILDFDTLPAKPQEILPLVRFRLRRMLPFDADAAAVSYQLLNSSPVVKKDAPVQVIAAAMPAEVREEIESMMRGIQREPGVLLPATLAAMAALPDTGSHLLVHTEQDSMTTAITHNGELLLYRTTDRANTDPGEMAQAVLVAAAYYEDTLHQPLQEVWVAGLESTDALRQHLAADGAWQIPLRSLVNSQSFSVSAVPSQVDPGRFTSVVGALRG